MNLGKQRETKESLRQKALTLLRNQKEDDRLEKSRVIQQKLFTTREFKSAAIILFYASFDGEVDTFEMIRQAQKLGKRIGLPRIIKYSKAIIPTLVENLNTDLEQGPFSILQPKKNKAAEINCRDIDLAIVPGILFDRQNRRLGRGGGYYDRFLSRLPSRIPTIGLAFDFQIVDDLPLTQKHDISVSDVICN